MTPLPFTGLTLIFSLIIICATSLFRWLRTGGWNRINAWIGNCPLHLRVTLSAMIMVLVSSLIAAELVVVMRQAPTISNAVSYSLQMLPHPECTTVSRTASNERVILRLDDIQAHTFSAAGRLMIEEAIAHNLPVVAGVIPYGLSQDTDMVRFLRANHCNLEIAAHGWTHQPVTVDDTVHGEFALLSASEAITKIRHASRVLKRHTGIRPHTFIPPRNQISSEAIIAVRDHGYPVISDNERGYFDIDADFWNYTTQQLRPANEVVAQCETTYSRGDELCVIMLHPQDIIADDGTIDPDKHREYTKLITYFSHERFAGTTFIEEHVALTERAQPTVEYALAN